MLTTELANQIAAILQRGLPIVDAVAATGISEDSYFAWIKKGERLIGREAETLHPDDRLYLEFAKSCKAARSLGKVSLLDALNNIALDPRHPKQAYALSWLLERMYPMQFGRRTIRFENVNAEDQSVPTPGLPGGAPEAACNVIIDGAITEVGPIVEEADDLEEPPE